MKLYIYIISFLLLFSSCSKFLEDYSQDLVVVKNVSDLDELLLGSIYIPSFEVAELNRGGLGWWLHILDDDVNTVIEGTASKGRVEMDESYYGYTTWQLEVGRNYSGTNVVPDNREWDELYRRINGVNIVLSEVENIDLTREEDRVDALRIKGESYFLRAQFYLTLVNLYGDMYTPEKASQTLGVPLKLTHFVEHDPEKNSQFDRNTVAQVYHQIEEDLLTSIELFNESPQKKGVKYRANKRAAMLLLSRVYLYMQEWQKAKDISQNLIEMNPDLMDYNSVSENGYVISDENPEIIFSQSALSLQNAFSGRGGDFCISNDLYKLYDENDIRKELYFTRAFNSDSIALNRKYRMGLYRSNYSDIFMLRNAEAYLNLAESCAMLGDAIAAQNWLDVLKSKRIDNFNDSQQNQNNIIEEIRNERRRELALEGHRWFDLRRYAVNNVKPFSKLIERVYAVYNWDDRNLLKFAEVYRLEIKDPGYTFPIPKSVLDFDIDIIDNPRETRKLTHTID